MRNLIVTEYVTIDGITEGFEHWFFPFWDDDIGKVKHNELFASDTLLYGRVTYQIFAAQWMERTTDETGFADRLYKMPKYVVSTTLEKAEWHNSSLIKSNVVEEIRKLKEQPGEDILVAGSSMLVQTLREHDLVDEYRLMVFPVLWGKGKRFFSDGDTLSLKLIDRKIFKSGVTFSRYQPDKTKTLPH
jgi:dihydrofolate reductase